MNLFMQKIKNLFFPPPNSTRWMRILPYAILGLFTIIAFSGGAWTWEYTNSSEYCGTACHTMPPEYSSYQVSPHARVQCVECHIGRDIITTRISRKAGDLRHVILNLTKNYEFPIRADDMQPAREVCETCHFPEKFSDDSLRKIYHYDVDENNSRENLYLIMKTGGGTAREGLGFGIHWHIENQVWYFPTDDLEQDIPFVRVIDQDGIITDYVDIASSYYVDPDNEELVLMDCITCHNRITHYVMKPEEAVGEAIRKGLIPQNLPYLMYKATEILRADYPDKQTGIESMVQLEIFYKENYPDIYQQYQQEIQAAVVVLQDIYEKSVFPEQRSDWDTHANNLGHKNDPGCFRCHDGKHFTEEQEAIRLECNLCHSVPVVVDPASFTTNVELVSGPEPPSHTHTSWIALHGRAADSSCTGCHTVPEGYDTLASKNQKPLSSATFCGNSACHYNDWSYAGFDSPALKPILDQQLNYLQFVSPYLTDDTPITYQDAFVPIFEGRCNSCHMGSEAKADLDLSTYQGVLKGGESGPGIVPGDIDKSQIYLRQTGILKHYGQMVEPEIDALIKWIQAGAPEE